MNRLSLARRTQVISALVEGNSIRSTEQMTDTHRDTIMRLMVEVGTGCAAIHNETMRDLDCRRIQCDGADLTFALAPPAIREANVKSKAPLRTSRGRAPLGSG
jgi:hypothetical protein